MLIRNKLTLVFILLVITIQLAFSTFIYLFYSIYRERAFYVRLQAKAQLYGRIILERKALRNPLNSLQAIDFATITGEHTSLFDSTGTILFTNQSKDYQQKETSLLATLSQKKSVQFNIENEKGIGITYTYENQPYSIFVTGINRLGDTSDQYLRVLLLIANLGGGVLIMGAGWYFSGRFLQPIARMVADVNQQSDSQLTIRLDEGNKRDELAQLAMTFNEMLTRLQTNVENQRSFISHASHELRTPLTNMLGTLQTSLSYDKVPDQWRRSMELAVLDSKRIIELTNGLLSLSKSENVAVARQPIRLDECIEKAMAQTKAKYPDTALYFQFGTLSDSDYFEILGHEPLLTTVLTNLLDNACKYSQQPVWIELSTEQAKGQYVITITDQGRGIPAEDLPYLFEPLYRGRNVGKTEGYGVGMAVAKRLIAFHKGTINVQSVLDQGTTITVRLPIYSDTATPSEPATIS
ncbi:MULTISPECIES: HAMP domain-containing sensor histidine kinase [Spirosoma]|uniref:histidine kinase n=1 Tax=Spirosoma liriopis TaxID=2937440 RepID=A0ABT0HU16_9BACT|nr:MULTISPECIES: HAMP domain-containing sensor histidine kinase [Spirosoma]MCK8495475.1 HAMP domain-containing histidine kinase [Spirosoma liriopis]UHG94362.1 HAMP domain-containing histidine kinase [Spirosoma oryzicola]